jgi:hypothetical protein
MQSSLVNAQANSPKITSARHVLGSELSVKIVNGILTNWYPTVGALLYSRAQVKFGSWCTGTLIGCDTFLTAAHCISDDQNASNYKVFLQHAGLFDVTSIAWQRDQFRAPNSSTGANADVAVLTLSSGVNGIKPHQINIDREHGLGRKGTIVGFGRTGGRAFDYGLKRVGGVTSAACRQSFPLSELVCWNYSGQQNSNTCNGDSGGPLFLSEGRPFEVISGVTSGGINTACLSTDHSFDTSVFHHKEWIKAAASAGLGQATCGSLAPLDEDDDRYHGFTGQITDADPEHVLEVEIENVQELRVGANLGKPADTDANVLLTKAELYIANGGSRDLVQPMCVHKSDGQAAFCSARILSDGLYTIILKRGDTTGVADFQLVVSAF